MSSTKSAAFFQENIATPVNCRDEKYGVQLATPVRIALDEHPHWQRILAQILGNALLL